MVVVGHKYERTDEKQTFAFRFEDAPQKLSIRLGPIPRGRTVRQAVVNGDEHSLTPLSSGDGEWVWVEDVGAKEGVIEVAYGF